MLSPHRMWFLEVAVGVLVDAGRWPALAGAARLPTCWASRPRRRQYWVVGLLGS